MRAPIKIGLSGSSGRMGQSISELEKSENSFSIQELFDSHHPIEKWKPENIDIVIDFSSLESFLKILSWCEKNKKPLVSGTTGLSSYAQEKLKSSSTVIPILWASNMSLGIACMNEWLKSLPETLKKWDVQIYETHHRFKKDSPSGTALSFHQTLKETGVHSPTPLSSRGGGIHGVHKISFMGLEEVLHIEHFAQDRKVFARGALKASHWLLKQKPGLYNIQNCL